MPNLIIPQRRYFSILYSIENNLYNKNAEEEEEEGKKKENYAPESKCSMFTRALH